MKASLAATKIQANFRGYRVRKQLKGAKGVEEEEEEEEEAQATGTATAGGGGEEESAQLDERKDDSIKKFDTDNGHDCSRQATRKGQLCDDQQR